MSSAPTPDEIRAALFCIPANLPREDWARIGMAIKSELPNDEGRSLFTEWSATAPGQFNEAATLETWRSVKAGGGVSIRTLFFKAKEHGYKPSKAYTPPSKAEQEAQRKAADDRANAERAKIAAKQKRIAQTDVARIWASASSDGHSPYLERKGVHAHGLRFGPGGVCYVPMLDEHGQLWNVQTIFPDGQKRFVAGAKKQGLFHLIGGEVTKSFREVKSSDQTTQATTNAPTCPPLVLIAEGYATAATLYEATGHPVAVAFDAGNLTPVAQELRGMWPQSQIVVCGDDDAHPDDPARANTGRIKATEAARVVDALAVFPQGLPPGGTDFNDLLQIGAHAKSHIKALIDQALNARATTALPTKEVATKISPKAGTSNARHASPRRFRVDDSGVWYLPPRDDAPDVLVCDPLHVVCLAKNSTDAQAALLLEFKTPWGMRRWLMPLTMLSGDGTAYRTALLDQGFAAPVNGKLRACLTEYLSAQTRMLSEVALHVPKIGWHGGCYVLPNDTIAPTVDPSENNDASTARVFFYNGGAQQSTFDARGSLDTWRENLGRVCVGNSRLTFAVCVSLAGPLLHFAPGTSSGGFHFKGASSTGKSTFLQLAATVWGNGSANSAKSFMRSWKATDNGLESVAEVHNDLTLILDELSQIDPKAAGRAAYMLANGQGKARAQAAGGNRALATWRLLLLSSGEVSLEQLMAEAGEKIHAGQEIRMPSIPAEVTPGTTLETLHGFASGHELSGHIQTQAAKHYGHIGRAWLQYLVNHHDTLSASLKDQLEALEEQIVPLDAAGQVKRVGRRFALVAAAGEMASAQGLTGWPTGEATNAAALCFNAWLEARGGSGNSEPAKMTRQVQAFLSANGESRFTLWHRAADDHAGKTINRAGFRRIFDAEGEPYKSIGSTEFDTPLNTVFENGGTQVFYIFPEVFKTEVCRGFDVKTVCDLLATHECLVRDANHYTKVIRLPGGTGTSRPYAIKSKIFEIEV